MSALLRKKLCVAAMAGLAGTLANTSQAGVWVGPTGTSGSPADWYNPANWTGTDASGVPGDGVGSPDDTLGQFQQALPPGDYFISIGSTSLSLVANGGSLRFPDFVNPTNDHSGKTYTFSATNGA